MGSGADEDAVEVGLEVAGERIGLEEEASVGEHLK